MIYKLSNSKKVIILAASVGIFGIGAIDDAEAQENLPAMVQHVVSSSTGQQDFRLFVVVPEEYSQNSNETYDIVYVLDINSGDSAQLLQFQRAVSQLPNVADFILVGIGFTPDEEHRGLRTAFFTPSPDKEIDKEIIEIYKGTPQLENSKSWESGRASEFAKVLATDIKPFVETNYRVSRKDTILGASLAGLFLTTVVFEQPMLFDNYVIVSPSVWWNDFELFDSNATLDRSDIEGRIYLTVGGLENSEMLESYKMLSNTFEQNESVGLMLHSEIIENQEHLSVVPIAYMRGLQYIYSQ